MKYTEGQRVAKRQEVTPVVEQLPGQGRVVGSDQQRPDVALEVLLNLVRQEVTVHQTAQTFQRRGGAWGNPSAAVVDLANIGSQAQRYGVEGSPFSVYTELPRVGIDS